MKLNAYSLFDNKALQYHPPFYTSTDAAAVRMVRDLVDDLATNVGRHPKDYTLYFVGEYDDSNGLFMAQQPLRFVVDAVALVRQDSSPVLPFKKEA